MENLITTSKAIEGCIEKLGNGQDNCVTEISAKIDQIKGLILMIDEFSDNFIVPKNVRKDYHIGFQASFSAVYSLLELLDSKCTEYADICLEVENTLKSIV